MVGKKDRKHDEDIVSEDEILPEDLEIDTEQEEELTGEKLRSLREKLASCENEKRRHLEDLQRTKADFLNSRRRLEEQLARDRERATDTLLMDLLPIMDSFETAMADRVLWESVDTRWRTGIEAIHAKLTSILKSNNIVTIDPIGALFNPEEHDAVSNISVTDDTDAERIITVLQKGFKRNNTVIRPARVVVGTK